jgi:hypothetical protein
MKQIPSLSTTQQEALKKQREALHKAAELKQMIDGLEKVNDEGRRSSLLDSIFSIEDILKLPLHPDPPGIQKGNLRVNLLKHQVGIYSSILLLVDENGQYSLKLSNGVSNGNIPFCRQRRLTSLFNFGNIRLLMEEE